MSGTSGPPGAMSHSHWQWDPAKKPTEVGQDPSSSSPIPGQGTPGGPGPIYGHRLPLL